MKITFDENQALRLYQEHKTDTEIAKALNIKPRTILGWRSWRKLPKISPRKRIIEPGAIKGVDYRKTLNPIQTEEMSKFLNSLLWASDNAKKMGIKPDVEQFMKVWRGEELW